MGRRCIDLDVHRDFAQVAVWENGQVRDAAQIEIGGEAIRMFADSLGPEDEVAIEATCYTHAIVRGLEPVVAGRSTVTPAGQAADAAEEPGSGDPSPQPRVAAARSLIRSESRAAAGSPASACPLMKTSPSLRCSGRSTSTSRSCGSSTPHWAASRWSVRRSSG